MLAADWVSPRSRTLPVSKAHTLEVEFAKFDAIIPGICGDLNALDLSEAISKIIAKIMRIKKYQQKDMDHAKLAELLERSDDLAAERQEKRGRSPQGSSQKAFCLDKHEHLTNSPKNVWAQEQTAWHR